MESWQEQAYVSCFLNDRLDHRLLCQEILLQSEYPVHAAPLVNCSGLCLRVGLKDRCFSHRDSVPLLLHFLDFRNSTLCVFKNLRLGALGTLLDDSRAACLTYFIVLVPDRLPFRQDRLDTFRLPSELWVFVILREAHLLDGPARVFVTRCWIRIVERNDGIAHLLLLPSGVKIHCIDIKGVLCEAFMCRGPIEYKNADAIGMGVFEDCDCIPDLFDELLQVPPRIEPFSRVNYLSGLERS